MKKALLLATLLCAGAVLWAQKVYFIYVQSENGSPFYVKMGDKVFSATPSGYLILPRLIDSTYTLQLGPSGEGEFQFSLEMRQKDHGFLLKRFSDGWGLFDLQTMQVIKPVNKATSFSSGVRSADDRFTFLLATASDDSTLFYQPLLVSASPAVKKEVSSKAEEVTTDTNNEVRDTVAVASLSSKSPNDQNKADSGSEVVNAVVRTNAPDTSSNISAENLNAIDSSSVAQEKIDTVAVEASAVSKNTEVGNGKPEVTKEKPVAIQPEGSTKMDTINKTPASGRLDSSEVLVYKRSKVIRRAESSTVDGFGLVFWDSDDKGVDTVKIFIPNQKFMFVDPEVERPASQPTAVAVRDTNLSNPLPATTAATKRADDVKTCNGEASDKDFFKIRKNLVAFENEKEMANAAKESFRKKCFSIEQLKSLSSLFLSQEGKWLFLEAAYPFASDKTQFSSLGAELREEPYLGRFKALIGK